MVAFFRDVRVEDCDLESDGDMLLFQWGVYDWGDGMHFEFDVTRQLIPRGGGDVDIWQLHLTVRFPPHDDLREFGAGDRWCHGIEQLQAFSDFVTSSDAFLAVADRTDGAAALDYEIAG